MSETQNRQDTDTTALDKLAKQLADTAVQAGMDKAARILADWLDTLSGDEYRDGADDALCQLIQAGAADPRTTEAPTIVGIETDDGVVYYEAS